MRDSNRVLAIVAALGCLALAASASAQTGTSSSAVAGTVKDTSGAVLPGVTVEAASPALIEKVRTVVTDGGGQYKLVNLPVGTYSVTFTLTGFNLVKREGIELTTNFTAPVNADLAVGSLEETVTVTSAAPLVDVQNTAVRSTVSRQALDTIPSGRGQLSVIAFMPGMAANPSSTDVGGSKGDQQPFFTFHGSNSSDSKFQLNGFSTSIGGGGARVFVPNPMNTQEIAVELGGGNAEQPNSGVQLNYISKSGSNTFAGDIIGSWTNGSFQSNNYKNSNMEARGVPSTSINHLDRIEDIGIGLGGALRQDKLWYYTAYRFWRSGNFVAGQYFSDLKAMGGDPHRPLVFDKSRPAINDYWGNNASIRLTWQATTRNKFNVHYEWEKHCDCTHTEGNNGQLQGLSSGEAQDRQTEDLADIFETEWTFPATNKLLFGGGVGLSRPLWQNSPQPEVTAEAVAITDAVTGQRWGAEPNNGANSSYYKNYRNKIEPRFSATYATGSHAFKAGLNLIHYWGAYVTRIMPNNMTWTYSNGVPQSVTEWDTPYTVRENVKADLSLYGQDQWTVKHLTLNYGLRFDYFRTEVPAQTLDPSPLRPVTINTDPVHCSPCSSDFQPRLSASYDLFGNGKTALKVGVGRYVLSAGGSVFNPANSVVHSATRTWTDSNGNYNPDCNLLNNAQNGECGAQNNAAFGTVRVTTNIDDAARLNYRRYNWQTVAGVQQELLPGAAVSVTYIRTSWSNFTVTRNLNVTPADFDPYCIPVPADSRLPLSGQTLCGLYAVSAAKFAVQSTNSLIIPVSGVSGATQTDIFNGVDVTINARLPRGAFVTGGTATGRQAFNNCYAAQRPDLVPLGFTTASLSVAPGQANNPNGFCSVVPPFQTQVKVQGSYPLPLNFQASASFISMPGIPVLAQLQVPTGTVIWPNGSRPLPGNAASVNVANLIAPLSVFEDRFNQLDLRFTRVFRMGNRRFLANLDIYNLMNGSGVLGENLTYGPNWTKPTQLLDGRIVKFGGQFTF
jgi:hypothetical protein